MIIKKVDNVENKYKKREDTQTNVAMEAMIDNMDSQNNPRVGSFWYDVENDMLFGVESQYAEDRPFYHSNQFNADIKTGRALHQDTWKRQAKIGRDKRFSGDYTLVPRGRVFEVKDKGFVVYTGDWINDYPQVKDLIKAEFELPENTEFVKDVHWDIGHGWGNEI